MSIDASINAIDILRAGKLARCHGLAVAVDQGRCRVERITYMADKSAHVEGLTQWGNGVQALEYLNGLKG